MDKIWLKSYPAHVAEDIDLNKYASLVDIFTESCKTFHDKTALSNFGSTLTYGELEEKSRHFAAYLQNHLGLIKGERVAIMLPNTLQYPVVLFGILRAGLVAVNVNPLYTYEELLKQVNDAETKTIIVLANFADTVAKARPHTNLQNIIVTQMGDLFSFPKSLLMNVVVKYIKKMVPTYTLPNAIPFPKAMRQGAHAVFKEPEITGDDIAFLQYTGGTTGVAKGAMLTHRNMVANVLQVSEWIGVSMTPGQEIIITALPLYHIFSLTVNCLFFLVIGARNILITNPRDMNNFVKELKNARFTAITGVNTLFNGLLHNSQFKEVDFSRLHLAFGGGMAVQESVAKKWKEVTGIPLLEGYGLTETSPVATINPVDSHNFNGSVGLPVSSTNISIRDDNGQELAQGEAGELWIKGPQVMQGYWKKPEETKFVLSNDGWLATGDIATVDAQGYVRIVDRKKDMIVVSGFNVYPNEVENIIASHPGVLEVGVIGIPCEASGEKVKALIVKNDQNLDKQHVIAHCREHLASYKVPKVIEFVNELPKSNVGKILRRVIKENNSSA